MLIYFCLYAYVGGAAILLPKTKLSLAKQRAILCFSSFFFLFLIIALRHPSMGVDLGYGSDEGYIGGFHQIAKFPWKEILKGKKFKNYEIGYIVLNKIISMFSRETQLYLAVCAFLSIIPLSIVVFRESKDVSLSIYLYLGLPVFFTIYSAMRQAIAIAICFIALYFIIKQKPFLFVLSVLIAFLFHNSAIIYLIAYPVYYLKISKKTRPFTLFLILIVFLFRRPLFSILSKIFKPDAIPDDNGAITLFVVFVLVYIFCFLFSSDENKKTNGLLNIFLLACFCQAFGGLYQTALRAGYYFIMVLPLLLPEVLEKIEQRSDKLILKIIVLISFVSFGLYSIYRSGHSWAMAYPYHWFWE